MAKVSRRSLLVGAGAAMIAPRRAAAVMPQMEITPTPALQDAPLRIRLSGWAPSSTVKVAAEMTARDGTVWRSHAVFRADGAGSVDVGSARPLEGTYKDPSPMGLVWSMAREQSSATGAPKRLRDPMNITFGATSETGTSIQTTVGRLLADRGVTYRPLESSSQLRGGWWLPAGPGPHPAVIVLGGSGGRADHDRAALYASHGFAALALAYFRAPGLPRGLVNVPLEYVGNAIDDALDTVRPPKDFVAVEGISRGGELALLVGATFPKVRAVVGIMASGLVMGAFGEPESGDPRPAAAWTLGKKPVPDLFAGNPRVDWSHSNPEVSLVPGYLAAMRDAPSVERATIPVERIRGPGLLITGKDDRLAPRFELAEIARRRLERHRHRWPYEHLSYENSGHTIAPPYIPVTADRFVHPVSKEVMALGGTTEGRAHANEDWWPKALAFLRAASAR
jgi:pimeloyl-ACP methyl ester carboxylesterase